MIGSLAFDGAAANANRSLIRNRSPHKREAYRAHVTWTPSVRVSAEADIRVRIYEVLAGVGNIGRMSPDGIEVAVALLPHANELGESHE